MAGEGSDVIGAAACAPGDPVVPLAPGESESGAAAPTPGQGPGTAWLEALLECLGAHPELAGGRPMINALRHVGDLIGWANLVSMAIRSGGRCRRCGGQGHLIHHRNRDRCDSRLRNLAVLCRACHIRVHAIWRLRVGDRSEIARRGWATRRRNALTGEAIRDQYLRGARTLAERRALHRKGGAEPALSPSKGFQPADSRGPA